MHGPKLRDLPLVLALVDEEYSTVFRDGHSLLYSEGVTLDAAVRHDIRQGTMYMLLCHPMVNFREILEQSFKGSLEHGSALETKRECEASLKMTLMEEVSGVLSIPGLYSQCQH